MSQTTTSQGSQAKQSSPSTPRTFSVKEGRVALIGFQGLPIELGDQIKFAVRTSGGAIRLLMNYSLLLPDGSIQTGTIAAAATAGSRTGSGLQLSGALPTSTLISAAVDVSIGSNASIPGVIYCEAYLQRGDQNTSTVAQILGDWNYAGHTVQFPGQIISMSDRSRPGNIRTILLSSPAGAADFAPVAVPASGLWKPISFKCLDTSGAGGAIMPQLLIRSLATNIQDKVAITATVLAASAVAVLTWARGLVQTSFASVLGDETHSNAMPDTVMIATDDISTLTDGVANAVYTAGVLMVEEWFAG